MAEPWEQDWSSKAPQSQGQPWEKDWSKPATKPSMLELLGETWPGRIAKGIYSGVTLPGDVYSGQTQVDPSNPEFMGRVTDLATMGSGAPRTALSAAEGAVSRVPTTEALHEASGALYDQARNSPYTLKAAAVGDWARGVQDELNQKGILGEFAPDTHRVLSILQGAHPDAVATGSNLVSAREALREASRNYANPREASAANAAIERLDRFIKGPPPESVVAGSPAEFSQLAENARGNYAAAKRSELVQDELETAQRNAAAANSGRNVDNAIRQRLNSVAKSDKKSAGFSDEEMAQMDRVIFGSPAANAMRTTGNLLGGGGGLGAAVYAIGSQFNPLLAAAPVAGLTLKKGADILTQREIRRLDEMVRSRSPLAEELMKGPQAPSPMDEMRRAAMVRALMLSQQPQQ